MNRSSQNDSVSAPNAHCGNHRLHARLKVCIYEGNKPVLAVKTNYWDLTSQEPLDFWLSVVFAQKLVWVSFGFYGFIDCFVHIQLYSTPYTPTLPDFTATLSFLLLFFSRS